MPRKPRLEFPGATYHVFNAGSSQFDLFGSSEAAVAFLVCLFQACERMGWRLHAFSLVKNQYHAAIETPRGNLSQGVHWLQRAFGNGFGRKHGGRGAIFSRRYRAVLVEPGASLGVLVDFIHLLPVQHGIVPFELLGKFRWSSFRLFAGPVASRAAFLSDSTLKRFADFEAYTGFLRDLSGDADLQRRLGFESVSEGWVFGSEEFRVRMNLDLERMNGAQDWGRENLREINEAEWTRKFEVACATLAPSEEERKSATRSAPWKVAIATWLRGTTSVGNRWLTERLDMGPPDAVSRYVTECQRGIRGEAHALLTQLQSMDHGGLP